ncbi:hypothetical protein LIER_34339 [Lithospermum erythrorhizon]|uniref:Uncharacterized protein n=1 Tax=Lithospermum erythrorhizon TaxID=34254 RepID=A0AAV3S3I8_LITER
MMKGIHLHASSINLIQVSNSTHSLYPSKTFLPFLRGRQYSRPLRRGKVVLRVASWIALQEVILYNPSKGSLCLILAKTPPSPYQGITSVCEAIQATKEGLSKKKKKRTLVKGENIPSSSEAGPGDKAASTKGKDKQGDILLAAKETTPPNTVPLTSMRGKRPIAFKKVKVVKKVASSPHPFSTAELPLRPTPAANLSPHSSPIAANPNSSSFSPPDVDLSYEPPSSSLVVKRPSDEDVLQGKEKRSKAASGF